MSLSFSVLRRPRSDEVPVTRAEENPYDSAVVEETMSAVTARHHRRRSGRTLA